MIAQTDIAEFIRLIRKDNRGATGWTRSRSSMRFTLDAIEAYNRLPNVTNFAAISDAIVRIPGAKSRQYADALDHLDAVLEDEGRIAHEQEVVRKLSGNLFRTTSGMDEYRNSFGNPFIKKLAGMGKGDRWLDGGAGQAKAMIEYLNQGGQAQCIATGYSVPEIARAAVRNAEEEFDSRFRYIHGKYFGEIDNRELDWPGGGDFDLITDLNGVLYYTKTLVEDLRRYLEVLAIGGILCFTDVDAQIDFENQGLDRRTMTALSKWLANIKGVRVELHLRSTTSYILTKTADDITIPPMTLTHFSASSGQNNPTRKYSCTLQLPHDPIVVTSKG